MKVNDENSRIRILDPDPLVRGMDPRIRIRPKMSWIRNTAADTVGQFLKTTFSTGQGSNQSIISCVWRREPAVVMAVGQFLKITFSSRAGA